MVPTASSSRQWCTEGAHAAWSHAAGLHGRMRPVRINPDNAAACAVFPLNPERGTEHVGRTSMSIQSMPPGCSSSFLQAWLSSSTSCSTCIHVCMHGGVCPMSCAKWAGYQAAVTSHGSLPCRNTEKSSALPETPTHSVHTASAEVVSMRMI